VTVAYLLVSLGVRVRNGQWARSAGPVTTDPPAQELADNQRAVEEELRQARNRIDDLTRRLDRSLGERERLLESVAHSPPPSEVRGTAEGVPEEQR
jgi:hypothetical protein